ncbi:MAG: ATP-binding protein [Melioribacteraceae bacterium]|nr:ATP-binding protein [Melioribacteraceae bacterium]
MIERELKILLQQLIGLPKETEWFELKEAKTSFHFNDIGKYFSALSNEANLKNKEYGWLVFGVADNGNIVGSNFRINRTDFDNLKFRGSGTN